MILYHHTMIQMDKCVVVEGVYTQIHYDLLALDISMEREKDPTSGMSCVLNLPPPDPNNFIPFEKVDVRVVLKWIDELTPEITTWQEQNTNKLIKLLSSYDHID